MRQLIYLSPVPWASYTQRPHQFAAWFHEKTGGKVLWIDPYPTRFPLLSDIRRNNAKSSGENVPNPSWIEVVCPAVLPIEPLPFSGAVNGLFWRSLLSRIDAFALPSPTLLAVGKPSVLALSIMKRLADQISVYDAMDDFPAFYAGFSRLAMRRRERELIAQASHVLVSSTALEVLWRALRPDVQRVPNAFDAAMLPVFRAAGGKRDRKILGYVGTIGSWFDWKWVIALAHTRPADLVRLIGPMFVSPPGTLPRNIEILPPLPHRRALAAMQDFDAGLIPFKRNDLTASVDPIKYYEYRALGLPVVATAFGEMALRGGQDGIFLSYSAKDISAVADKALQYQADAEAIRRFTALNTWSVRFSSLQIIP